MENKDSVGDKVTDLLGDFAGSHSLQKDTGNTLRRENDSLDDFEHLEHDVSPVKEIVSSVLDDKSDFSLPDSQTAPRAAVAEVVSQPINTNDSVVESASLIAEVTDTANIASSLIDSTVKDTMSASDLLDIGGDILKPGKTENASDLLSSLSYVPPVPPHAEPDSAKAFGDFDNINPNSKTDIFKSATDIFKTESQNFMDTEREEFTVQPVKIASSVNDLADRFSDSEPEIDDFKQSNDEFKISNELKSDLKPETFKDVFDEPEPELPKRDYFDEPSPVKEVPKFEPDPVKLPEVVKTAPEPKIVPTIAPVTVPEPEPEIEPEPICKLPKVCQLPKANKAEKKEVIAAEAMFCKMGLDAWFNPERLNPKVESLIYWRDPKKSGAVFGGILVVLLSLAYFSLISVAAYLSLLALAATISFRIYKNVLQAVQKTGDGHPFKELLEADVTLPQDKVKEVTEVAVTHINAAVVELRRLFLVEDLVDSIKFGVLLWCLTYVGAWFNGMTIIIIAFIALFTLPKVYENNKTQIDANLDIVRTKLAEITSKVKAAIPIGKKSEEKKEQ